VIIKLLSQVGSDPPGAIVEHPDAEARGLIRAGFAEPALPGAVPTRPSRGAAPETAVKPPGGETGTLPGRRP
jgi:hypothetical protein